MTTVAETVTFATHGDELKTYLGITGDTEDERLERWLSVATKEADHFLDPDEELEEVHDNIVTGCFEWVRLARQEKDRPTGLKSVKDGDFSKTWADDASEPTPETFTLAVAGYWWPFKEDICP